MNHGKGVLLAGWLVALGACADDDSSATASMGTDDDGGTAAATSTAGPTGSIGDSTTSGVADDSSSGGGSTGEPLPDPLPPLSAAPLTTEETLVPIMPEPRDKIGDPRVPEDIVAGLADGFGDYAIGPGEPIETVTPTGEDPAEPGGNASMLARFVHLADPQVADDEAATRVMALDDGISGSFRPQDHVGCNIVDAAVRTINRVHEDLPLDFVVLGGDNIDNAQTNELEWFLGVMDGAPVVHCDSADDDDPVPGEGNDPKDPFAPVGLDVPWYWVSGNHDTLVQGNFPIEGREAAAVSANAPGGTRDWSQPGGPMVMETIADEGRALVDQATLLSLIAASGDGHGITDEVLARDEADYTFDVGRDLRFVVLDTSAPLEGGSSGVVRDAEVDSFLRPALDEAQGDGKIVVLVTHHAAGSITGTSDDALSTADFEALLGEYDNIVMHLAGHSHVHRARMVEPLGGHAYWEVITSALADYPNQMRVVEIHDEDNGEIRIQLVALNYQTEDDPQGASGRALQILDHTTGWTGNGSGAPEDRNVSLYLPRP